MRIRFTARVRIIAVMSALGLAGGMLSLAGAPARAASAAAHSTALKRASASATRIHLAADPFPLRNYEKSGNWCLGISYGRDNAPAILWGCNGRPDQQWHFGAHTSWDNVTWYQIINNDNQCLGVLNGSTSRGATIVGWNCANHTDQYWWEDTGITICNGYHPLFNFNAALHGSWEVAGVSGGRISQGTPIILYRFQAPCNNQEWAG
jgi:Ricin-type beta-trefoil lectin domain